MDLVELKVYPPINNTIMNVFREDKSEILLLAVSLVATVVLTIIVLG